MDIQSLWLRTQELWGLLDQHPWVRTGLALILLLTAALVLGRVARFVLLYTVRMLGRQPSLHWINDFRHNKVFHRLAQMVPSLVVQFGLNLVPGLTATGKNVIGNLAMAFTILFMTLAIGALLNALLDIYARTEHARTRSIKGYVQLSKMILYVFAAIIIVATLIDRSPLLLLSGLGAMSAVILLVYKDTLLSFVASVQLTSNDMLRVGDWIEMPQVGADGDVVDITLHTVKVQNFDKTIVSIPTWRLMSESFRNWRGMQQSGGRRIKRSLFIDASGVRFVRDDEEQQLMQIHLLTDYIGRKQSELLAWNEAQGNVAQNVRQPPPHDQHRHLPRLRPGLPEKPRRYQSRHDLHGPPAGADFAGHPAGNLLLHAYDGVGGLRADTGGYFRLSDYGDAGVWVELVSAAEWGGYAGGVAGAVRPRRDCADGRDVSYRTSRLKGTDNEQLNA